MNFLSFSSRWFNTPKRISNPEDPQVIGNLYTAIINNDESTVKDLLERGALMKKEHFLEATNRGSIVILQAYLDNGWDTNTPMDSHNPPALAFTFNDEKLVNWFLDHGADPNKGSIHQDCTPLSLAARDAPYGVIELLLNRGGSVERGQLLHYAVQRKHEEDRVKVLQYIFSKIPTFIGNMINKIKDEDNQENYCLNISSGLGTPLHSAAREGHLDAVRFLLEKGADVQRQDPHLKKSASEWAEYYGHELVVEELRNASRVH